MAPHNNGRASKKGDKRDKRKRDDHSSGRRGDDAGSAGDSQVGRAHKKPRKEYGAVMEEGQSTVHMTQAGSGFDIVSKAAGSTQPLSNTYSNVGGNLVAGVMQPPALQSGLMRYTNAVGPNETYSMVVVPTNPKLREEAAGQKLFSRLNQVSADLAINDGRPAAKECGNCGRKGHVVKDCIAPGPSGFVEACPLCNEKHSFDRCIGELDEKTVFDLLIGNRGNRPAIAVSTTNWPDLLKGAVMRHKRAYPWSRKFAAKWRQANAGLIQSYNYRRDTPKLPIDPDTATTKIVCESKVLGHERFRQAHQMQAGFRGGSAQQAVQQPAQDPEPMADVDMGGTLVQGATRETQLAPEDILGDSMYSEVVDRNQEFFDKNFSSGPKE